MISGDASQLANKWKDFPITGFFIILLWRTPNSLPPCSTITAPMLAHKCSQTSLLFFCYPCFLILIISLCNTLFCKERHYIAVFRLYCTLPVSESLFHTLSPMRETCQFTYISTMTTACVSLKYFFFSSPVTGPKHSSSPIARTSRTDREKGLESV